MLLWCLKFLWLLDLSSGLSLPLGETGIRHGTSFEGERLVAVIIAFILAQPQLYTKPHMNHVAWTLGISCSFLTSKRHWHAPQKGYGIRGGTERLPYFIESAFLYYTLLPLGTGQKTHLEWTCTYTDCFLLILSLLVKGGEAGREGVGF